MGMSCCHNVTTFAVVFFPLCVRSDLNFKISCLIYSLNIRDRVFLIFSIYDVSVEIPDLISEISKF